ncbi:hypothetical protein E2C01_068438 [Portunus trituberculatus]|uniref:Uncharacterized protein n=1 Tax=Portunus trituberculatus TaxID=210409 RepID=A0A5B7HRZ5_PORTR|nr:hypothetical protein [Portunus trituberculatus]
MADRREKPLAYTSPPSTTWRDISKVSAAAKSTMPRHQKEGGSGVTRYISPKTAPYHATLTIQLLPTIYLCKTEKVLTSAITRGASLRTRILLRS